MDSHYLSTLEKRFAIPGQVRFFEGSSGLPMIEINNAHASTSLCLQGAQILTFTPHGQAPVVWLSPAAKFVPGKSARGGVPVCWPWFGPHATDASLPAHGFARSAPWQVLDIQALEDGSTRLGFQLIQDEASHALWPYSTRLELWATVGAALEIELTTLNLGAVPLTLGEALHTYFQVSDVRAISVSGLDSCEYLDKADGGERKLQSGPIRFEGETDRVYLNTRTECRIEDPGLARRILIEKSGSRSTVVWNPWNLKAERMGDYEEDGYLRMVCVESGNAADDAVRLEAGAEHRLWVRYSLESA